MDEMAEFLKFLRQVYHKTIEDVAENLGVSVEEVKGWEEGKKPHPAMLYALAIFYKIPYRSFALEEIPSEFKQIG